jgi:alcohol dehydrogenase
LNLEAVIQAFDFHPRTRLIFGEGAFERLGAVARDCGFKRSLIVADPGIVASGFVERAAGLMSRAGLVTLAFHDFNSNPDSSMVEAGASFARPLDVDSIIGLGGGSSMDCAKGINFLLTNGGTIRDYWGWSKAAKPLLPMIGVPTTSGTGSEAQSYALISDAESHAKMACGDPGAAFRIAILDPLLTVSQPARVTATSGIDAIAHAVETFVTTKRNAFSELLSMEAWRLLEANYERVLSHPADIRARSSMQLGAFWAGLAIENSMLGAAHACANPLSSKYDTDHGVAVGVMLPHVVRWNAATEKGRYAELLNRSSVQPVAGDPAAALAARLDDLLAAGGLPRRLRDASITHPDFDALSADAARQWTGQFNPRPFSATAAADLYRQAY